MPPLNAAQINRAAKWLKTWRRVDAEEPAELISFTVIAMPGGGARATALFLDPEIGLDQVFNDYDESGELVVPERRDA